ncbi:hypothetical protein E3N88_29444 [Mikania micrantha]|uniref:Uncharacterized protein n=1 Tax=Mikania micrantha TaxID=192012 RepID=A0A5N6MIT9_9ASTR|nr:hypothetical protein E3N88_29444 [Mikania micrantha]
MGSCLRPVKWSRSSNCLAIAVGFLLLLGLSRWRSCLLVPSLAVEMPSSRELQEKSGLIERKDVRWCELNGWPYGGIYRGWGRL